MGTFTVWVCTAAGPGWSSGSATTIGASESLYFGASARADFGVKITVGDYNDSMHAANSTASGATDKCAAPHAHNIKYVSSDACSIDNAANEALTNIATAECVLVQLSFGTGYAIDDADMWFGSGSDATALPVNATCQAFEKGDSTWTEATAGATLQLTTSASTSQNWEWYIAMSLAPQAAGFNNSNKFKVEVTYS